MALEMIKPSTQSLNISAVSFIDDGDSIKNKYDISQNTSKNEI